MTSMTRLPTGTPVRPWVKPGIMPPPPRAKVNGMPADELDGQVELKTAPVRQFTATYWATTVWPAVSLGPVPWIRVFTTSLLGGVPFGTVTTGALPVGAVTDGRLPPPEETCCPDADAVGLNGLIRSMTQTVVSVPLTPSWESPEVPYPSAGGTTASTRVPIVLPLTAAARPFSPTWAGRICGTLVNVLLSSLCVFPLHT